jgi:hypothetical protein
LLAAVETLAIFGRRIFAESDLSLSEVSHLVSDELQTLRNVSYGRVGSQGLVPNTLAKEKRRNSNFVPPPSIVSLFKSS